MIDPEAVAAEFIELVETESLSREEERVAALVADKLTALGLAVERDEAGEPIGGQCGNVIAKLRATAAGSPTIMLNAHLDTVTPGAGIRACREGDVIRSGGDTVLGADDKAGVAIILAALREIIAAHVPHGELQVVFTIAEEIGLYGARHLDYGRVSPDFALVFDGGREMGALTVAAPSALRMTWQVHGRAAHAGVCPEKGVNAIRVAAEAIGRMRLGRLDDETTANIGHISGGQARNIVPDFCEVWGEARSHGEEKLQQQLAHMQECFAEAVAAHEGARVETEVEDSYRGFRLSEEEPVVALAARAARTVGLEPKYEVGGGGSDANVFNERGIPAVIMATGPENVHTLQEQVKVSAMVTSAEWLVEVVRTAATKP